MNKYTIWVLASLITASASLPIIGNAAEVFVSTDNHIRTLAASCAACHGSNGNSASITPTLAGLEAGYFTTQMLGFKDGSRASTVMHHHAKGLNPDEINQLAVYFSQQKRSANMSPKPQTLMVGHDN
jgi:cytochrome subunit of sulfide dehydrogenase